ncbi:MAG: hypothetical protein ACI3ZY_07465 [Parabacteroides sp.]
MARTVDYVLKGEKIKKQIDDLVKELKNAKSAPCIIKGAPKISDIDFEKEDIKTLQQLQVKLAKIILEKSK